MELPSSQGVFLLRSTICLLVEVLHGNLTMFFRIFLPVWFQVGGPWKANLCEICKADVKQQPLSLNIGMDSGDERRMLRCEWVPVGSSSSPLHALFLLTLALLTKSKQSHQQILGCELTEVVAMQRQSSSKADMLIFLCLPLLEAACTLLSDSPENCLFFLGECLKRAGDFSLS